MIVKFALDNFMSFNNAQEMLFVPGRSRDHEDHVIEKYKSRDLDILKTAIIYGANASGKSNIVKAIAFMQDMVMNGCQKSKGITYKKFALEKEAENRISKLEIEFRYNDNYYAYGFTFDNISVKNEWLSLFNKERDQDIFKRETKENGQVEVIFEHLKLKSKQQDRLKYIGFDTLPNELFLHSLNKRNTNEFDGIHHLVEPYIWFVNSLTVIFPNSTFIGLEAEIEANAYKNLISYFLKEFDTGIHSINPVEVDFYNPAVNIPEDIKHKIVEYLELGSKGIIKDTNNTRYTIIKEKEGKIRAMKMMTSHQNKDTEALTHFEINEESDGTQRIIDLIPVLAELTMDNKVFIIDELDRSLHPLLSKIYFKLFFELSKGRKSQMIVTTHEDYLLNLSLFRKDEFWFVNKNEYGESEISALEEYKIRKDLDIRNGYMDGRFLGIPKLPNQFAEVPII